MARQNYWESDFVQGEISPRMHSRIDLQKYAGGVSDLTNFIVQLQGGIARRSGTVFVSEVVDSTAKALLIPFIIDGGVAYVIEMGDYYFRFYTQGGLLYTNAPVVNLGLLLAGSPSTNFELLTTDGLVVGLTYTITGVPTKVIDGSYFTMVAGVNQTLNQPWIGTNGPGDPLATLTPTQIPFELTTPYATADLPLVDYTQSADTMFIVHPNYAPQMLQRTDPNTFALTPFNFQDGPYMTINQDQGQFLEHSGFNRYQYLDPVSGINYYQYNGTGVITASGTSLDGNPFAPFVSTDVGRWIRILQGSFWGAVQITSIISSTQVNATCFGPIALSDTGKNKITLGTITYPTLTIYPTYEWRIGSWSDTTGWPSTVTFHQGRLCFANTPTEPDGFWASESGIFNLFSPTENDVSVVDSDGLGYTIVSNQLNEVQWMISSQALMIGTYGTEFAVITASNGTPLTPSNISFQQQSAFGAKKVRPYLIGISIIYVQRSGKKLREQTYDWSINGWRSIELSMLAEHLFREGGGIAQAAYQQEPGNNWWGCREDGVLVGMTYVKEQQILGFHKHVIGGNYMGNAAIVESVCCIPTPDATQDQLWLIVKRTINGTTRRYVEFMDVVFDSSVAGKNTMNFVDSGLQSAGFPVPLGSAISTVTGLSHLEGESVTICGDTQVQNSKTVSSGQVTLDTPAKLLTVGLPYVSQMTTLPLPVQGDTGTGQGVTKRIDRVVLRILDSLTFKIGKDYNHLATAPFSTVGATMDTSPNLFTGDFPMLLNSGNDTTAQFSVQADLPYPFNLLGMSPQSVVQQR